MSCYDATLGKPEGEHDAQQEQAFQKMDTWYVHFASCFYIYIYRIMDCYFTLCHNTYVFSLLFYKVYMKRENAGS